MTYSRFSQATAIVIGGGFFGVAVASYLSRTKGFKSVKLIERNSSLLSQASYRNQARVHGGYHYPRSALTAIRSQINMPKFLIDWPDAVFADFTSVYAVARSRSKTNGLQFRRFCKNSGLAFENASPAILRHFNLSQIEDVLLAREYVFDSKILAVWAGETLADCGVEIHFETHATEIRSSDSSTGKLLVNVSSKGMGEQILYSNYVFNCSYSGINSISGDFEGTDTALKHEIAEIALIQPPEELRDIGITIMDGPFFSMMPFPAENVHSLSHVTYTPHISWTESEDAKQSINPYLILASGPRSSRSSRMIRDASKFVPRISESEYLKSLYEVKTVLSTNEIDDGRPILFEKHPRLHGLYSILGGKIDNVYDVLSRLDEEDLSGK